MCCAAESSEAPATMEVSSMIIEFEPPPKTRVTTPTVDSLMACTIA